MAPRLSAEQRRVARAMALAVVVTVATLVLAGALNPFRAPTLALPAERLAYAISLEGFDLLWLAAAIGDVARRRFFSPGDIGGSGSGIGESNGVREARAVLQNTLEQTVLAVAAHGALAVRLMPGATGLLPALVALFGVGRLLFWLGYRGGAGGRALGFALTFYPSVAACLLAVALAAIAPPP